MRKSSRRTCKICKTKFIATFDNVLDELAIYGDGRGFARAPCPSKGDRFNLGNSLSYSEESQFCHRSTSSAGTGWYLIPSIVRGLG